MTTDLPAEETMDTVKGIYDNFAQTVVSMTKTLVVVNYTVFRSTVEGKQCRIQRCRFANRSILPFHLKEAFCKSEVKNKCTVHEEILNVT